MRNKQNKQRQNCLLHFQILAPAPSTCKQHSSKSQSSLDRECRVHGNTDVAELIPFHYPKPFPLLFVCFQLSWNSNGVRYHNSQKRNDIYNPPPAVPANGRVISGQPHQSSLVYQASSQPGALEVRWWFQQPGSLSPEHKAPG